MSAALASHATVPDLGSYDRIVVAFSGGKDSVASLLTVLEAGVPPERIDVYHHDVDGAGPSYMDWPCTTAYCRAVTQALGVPLYLSWKEGGFLREMLRDGVPTAPICFQTPEGTIGRVGGHGPAGTRLRFPQVTADLNQRWCSAYLKIDVMAALIRNQDRFLDRRTLIVTGERAEESRARAGYATFEPDRSDTRAGTRRRRHVDHWRPVHRLTEAAVWEMLRRHGIVPAPAYRLGWSRLSCIACIFGGADQWASYALPSRRTGSSASPRMRTASGAPSSAAGASAPSPIAAGPTRPWSSSRIWLVSRCSTPGMSRSGCDRRRGPYRPEHSEREQDRAEEGRCRPATCRARVGPGACGALARRAAGRRGEGVPPAMKGDPDACPIEPGWTGPTRPSRPCAPYGARATRRPRSAAAWTPPRTRSWARPIASSCRRGRRRSGLRRRIARSGSTRQPSRQSWPASFQLPVPRRTALPSGRGSTPPASSDASLTASRSPGSPHRQAAGTCQWPIGEPGKAGFHLCGDEPAPGKPYCPSHCGRAYVRPRIAVDAFAAS